jgi:tubulin monoglycylase TTLL3/8
MLKQKRE